MKSILTCLLASAALVLAAAGSFSQEVVPAVSLGDPTPSSQPDYNLVPVSGSSHHAVATSGACNGCKLDFQPCCDPGKGCKEIVVSVPCTGCSAAPQCATCAKPAPCKACEVVKHVHKHAPACTTCAAPAPAPAACTTCAAPAPAPCATCAKPSCACESRKHVHSHTPALAACNACAHAKPACTTCAAPAPAPCKTCAAPAPAPCAPCVTKPAHHSIFRPAPAPCATKTCDTCKAAPAPTCETGCKSGNCGDPCKAAHSHARSHTSRPILDSLRGLFSGHSHSAPKAEACGCSTCSATAGTVAPSVAQAPIQPQPAPVAVPHVAPIAAPVAAPVAAPMEPMNPPVTSIPPSQPIYQPASQPAAPVPASLAPYNPNSFSTAYPPEPSR